MEQAESMSGVSLPVSRPSGKAIVVATPACQAQPLGVLVRLGIDALPVTDPYAAMLEIARRPLVYRALIVSLQSVYREELQLISTLKRRFPHVEIWLTQTDGRHAALAEGMRLGADGLLDEEGLHRTAAPLAQEPISMPRPTSSGEVLLPIVPAAIPLPPPSEPVEETTTSGDDPSAGEPVLTADELRALLQEQPSMPPSGEN
jgi:hypothetical protein